MRHARLLGLMAMFLSVSLLVAGDDDKLVSGPKAGATLPGAFECYNVNGPAKGRHHCLVCQFALNPAMLVFVQESAAGKNDAVTDLLKKLDDAAADFNDRNFSVGVVFLSPDARDSTNTIGETDAAKIIDETVNREKLTERLKKRAEPLKHVIIAYYPPDGPKSYNLNPKAEVTALLYDRMRIVKNFTYAITTPDDVEAMVKQVRETLTKKKG